MVLSGFKFSELSRYCWFFSHAFCEVQSTFLQCAVLGKDSASPRPDAQRLMFDVYSFLIHSVGFMPLYSSWYSLFDPFWESRCICVFCVVFFFFGEGHALQWGWGFVIETHRELYMRHQPCANTGLNICQNLSLWIIVLQIHGILYSTSWQTQSLIVHLVKILICAGRKKLDGKTFCSILRTILFRKETRTCEKYLGNTHLDECCMSVH